MAVGYQVMQTVFLVSVFPILWCICHVSSVSRRLSYGGLVISVLSDIAVPHMSFIVSCISLTSNVMVSSTQTLRAFSLAISIISGSISVPIRVNDLSLY